MAKKKQKTEWQKMRSIMAKLDNELSAKTKAAKKTKKAQ